MENFMNRIGNPWMRTLLKSRLHGLLGEGLALVIVRGRRTGNRIEVPVEVCTVWGELIAVSLHDRTWWRNLRDHTDTTLWLHGQPAEVSVEIVEDLPTVQAWLAGLLLEHPAAARYLKVPSDAAGQPQAAPLLAAAQQRVIAVFRPRITR
jgi:hypothetical protein